MSAKTTVSIWIAWDSNECYEVGRSKSDAMTRYLEWHGEDSDGDVRCCCIETDLPIVQNINFVVDGPKASTEETTEATP